MNIKVLIFTNEEDAKQVLEAIDKLGENPKFLKELESVIKKLMKTSMEKKS